MDPLKVPHLRWKLKQQLSKNDSPLPNDQDCLKAQILDFYSSLEQQELEKALRIAESIVRRTENGEEDELKSLKDMVETLNTQFGNSLENILVQSEEVKSLRLVSYMMASALRTQFGATLKHLDDRILALEQAKSPN